MLRISEKESLVICIWYEILAKCNIGNIAILLLLLLLIQVEETKLNNHNVNDHETAHAGTFS